MSSVKEELFLRLIKEKGENTQYIVARYLLWGIIFVVFTISCVLFYASKLSEAFQQNAIIYASEIAKQAGIAVDSEIQDQWETLERTVSRVRFNEFQKSEEMQEHLEKESQLNIFRELIFITEDGIGYSTLRSSENVLGEEWASTLLQKKEKVALLDQNGKVKGFRGQFLLTGIPIKPIQIDDKKFVAIVGICQLKPILDKLDILIFNGKGMAHLLDQKGMAVSIHSNSVFSKFNQDNLFEVLKTKATFQSGYSFENMIQKANEDQISGAVISMDGKDIILSMNHISSINWYLMISSLETVTNEQTNHFLTLTLFLFTAIACIIGSLLAAVIWSRRKHNQDKLYREQLFGLISTHVNEVFVIYDVEKHHYEYVSDNIERVFGVTKEDYIETKGNILCQLMSKSVRDVYQESIEEAQKAISEGSILVEPIYDMFSCLHKKTSELMWINRVTYMILTELETWKKHKILRLILVYSDCTSLKKRELELEDAVSIAKASEASARKVEKSKTLFFSSVSHEIRTPLNGIVGLIDLMEKYSEDSIRVRDYLRKTKLSAKFLLSLINDILDMAKLENGNLKLKEGIFNLFDIMNEMETIFYHQCLEKGIRFIIRTDRITSYYLYNDALRIQQILVNLLSNAVKFTEKGMITLTVEQKEWEGDKILTRFIVEDTGCGMSEEFLQRLGNPFEQENLKNNRKYASTGLGLAISRQFVQMMEGKISVESKMGKGTIFLVELPCKRAKQEEDVFVETFSREPDQLRGMQLLIAEDNDLNMEILTTVLDSEGILCSCAKNGKVAVELFAASELYSFDAILMDLQMPILDGYEATDRIREMDRLDAKDIPIVACTANMLTDEIEKIEAHGMSGFFTKPIVNEELFQFLYKLKKEPKEGAEYVERNL